jgi:Na+/proline symporter
MTLTVLDWLAIAVCLVANVAIGLHYRRRATSSTETYFVSGRNVSGWLAGTSMVATTFASDTLFEVGKLIFGEQALGVALIAVGAAAGVLIYRDLSRRGWASVIG